VRAVFSCRQIALYAAWRINQNAAAGAGGAYICRVNIGCFESDFSHNIIFDKLWWSFVKISASIKISGGNDGKIITARSVR
jgi:hypothetical protein